ncbi:hypothetical protein AB0L40_24020 [Patulibacter sp. NPDC049589]|uniref:hypothetical protein n=1 Tax=Patulibacter sp. NPDC049589 TaxID=3154731 RepID=UPI00341D4238
MRHPQLHAALTTAGLHAARELAALVDEGDEVPFELLEHARRARSGAPGPTLYSYRPLVGLYIERHADALAALPGVAEAQHTMVAAWGVEAYLQARGVERPPADPHERASLAVRQFLERLFEDAPDFVVHSEHFDRAFAELESVMTADATETVVVIPLVGVSPAMATVAITRGVALQRPEALKGEVPDAALSGPDGTPADAVATLRWSARPGSAETPRRAREASRRLITALRLHVAGATPSAGPLVWLRPAGAPWRAMAVGGTIASRGVVTLDAEDVPDLRTFVDLVARRLPQSGEVAWALRRWTLALDRDRPEETLTDLLLAARALLEPEGPRSGRLAGRLAALCAVGDDRARLSRRFARLALQEQEVVAGSRRIDRDLPDRVDELADCLRAVLRDCVVGHLRGDLVELAEEILDGVVDEARTAPAGWPSERVSGTAARDALTGVGPAFDDEELDFDDLEPDDDGLGQDLDELERHVPGAERSSGRTVDDAIDAEAYPVTSPEDPRAARPIVSDAEAERRVPGAGDPDGPAIHRAERPASPRGAGREDLDSEVPEFRPTGEPYPAALRPLDPDGEIRASRRRERPQQLWLDVTWDEPQLHEPADEDDDDSTGPWPVSEAS